MRAGEAAFVDSGAEMLRRLVNQVTSPVRWDACMDTMIERGVRAVVELPPAGALTGLAKRAMTGTTQLALRTPDDLDKVAELIKETAA